MPSKMAANGHSEDLTIYYNDSIDSDNSAAALGLLKEMAQRRPTERAIWILEPRQVAWGLETTNKDMDTCQQLLMRYFPEPYKTKLAALKAVLGGLVEEDKIDSLAEQHDISVEDLALLRKGIRAPYGKREHAETHARLMAWDLASCLTEWSRDFYQGAPVPKIEVLIDNDSLSEVKNPVNLNLHHHEELATRTQKEINEYRQRMELYNEAMKKYDQVMEKYSQVEAETQKARENPGQPSKEYDQAIKEYNQVVADYEKDLKDHQQALKKLDQALKGNGQALEKSEQAPKENDQASQKPEQFSQRLETLEEPKKPDPTSYLEAWYGYCINQLENQCNNQVTSVTTLDIDSLCKTISAARRVRFMGGSSLRILRQFIEKGVASKIDCCLQVGSYDLGANLFANQFNVALNLEAARSVFAEYKKFSSFTVVPSATAQSLKFSLVGLERVGHECLGKKMLGFNAKLDPDEIAEGKKTLKDNFSDKVAPMPDLTTFLCALKEKEIGAERSFVQVNYNEKSGVLLFERADKGIPMYHLPERKDPIDAEEVVRLLDFSEGGD